MYNFILLAHSGWAYIVLLTLVIAIVSAGSSLKKPFTQQIRRIGLFGLIATHVQFVLGLILYFVSPNGYQKIANVGMGAMSSLDRLLALEHPLINLIAVIIITIGWSRHKRLADNAKAKSIAVFYAIGLVLLLSRLPWQTWFD
jgi:heme A synthase